MIRDLWHEIPVRCRKLFPIEEYEDRRESAASPLLFIDWSDDGNTIWVNQGLAKAPTAG